MPECRTHYRRPAQIAVVGTVGAPSARLENGRPRNKINLSADYCHKIFGPSLGTGRLGEVQTKNPNPACSYIEPTFSAKRMTDLTLSAKTSKNIDLSMCVNNLFKTYPDRLYQDPNNEQSLAYSTPDGTNRSRFLYNSNQFGFNGAFYFGRVNFTLMPLRCKEC